MEIEETQTGNEPSEADLLALAMKADAGELDPTAPIEAKSEPESPTGEPAKEDNKPKLGDEPAKEKPDLEKGDGTKLESESAYAKAQKENERKDKSWKKLDEEKAAFRAEQLKLEEERRALGQTKAKAEVYRDDKGYSADDYDAYAKQIAEDNPELAQKAKERAAELRNEERQTRTQATQEQFAAGWQANLAAAIKDNEELNDQNSELGQAVSKVLKENPIFSMSPDGITHAVTFAKAQRQAGLVPSLEAKVKEQETEIARLNKLTGLSGSGPTQKPGIKSFDEMSSAEQDAELERLALEADRNGT